MNVSGINFAPQKSYLKPNKSKENTQAHFFTKPANYPNATLLKTYRIGKITPGFGSQQFRGKNIDRIIALQDDYEQLQIGNITDREYESRTDFKGIDLSGADLSNNIMLYKCNLEGANLEGAKLWCEALHDTNLTGANLKAADLNAIAVEGTTNFEEADLSGAQMENAVIMGINCRKANFTNAILKNAELRGSDFFGANFEAADMREADLEGACLKKARIVRNLQNPEKSTNLNSAFFVSGCNNETKNTKFPECYVEIDKNGDETKKEFNDKVATDIFNMQKWTYPNETNDNEDIPF